MSRFVRAAAVAVALVVTLGANAWASAPQVQLHLSAAILNVIHGRIVLSPMNRAVKTGEIVRYDIVARNVGTAAAYQLAPLGNVPARMQFVKLDESPSGSRVEFTADGKHWSSQAAPATKQIRWTLLHPLAPHAQAAFAYEVRVK